MPRKAVLDIYEEPRTNYVGFRIGDTLKENLETVAFIKRTTLTAIILDFLENYIIEHEDELMRYHKLFREYKKMEGAVIDDK